MSVCFYQVRSRLELKHVTQLGSLVLCAASLEGGDSGGWPANFSSPWQAGHLSGKENGSQIACVGVFLHKQHPFVETDIFVLKPFKEKRNTDGLCSACRNWQKKAKPFNMSD